MIQYNTTKPKAYIETTVVSYLVARPSRDVTLVARQQATQQLWIEYTDNIEYLVSWNYKHIVNETKRNLINEVCHAIGFQPTTLCTPIELIEEIQVKEKHDTRMDPVLEECYRMKEEFAAQFKSSQELYDYLKAEQKKFKALGWKYLPPPPARNDRNKKD